MTLREAMEDYLTGMAHRKLSPRSMVDLEGNITYLALMCFATPSLRLE